MNPDHPDRPQDPSPSPRPATVAEQRFAEARRLLDGKPAREVFQHIYHANLWGSAESPSGLGSQLDATRRLREGLPGLLRRLGVRTLLDLPCGDFSWLATTPLPIDRYLGADIVPELVARNATRFAASHPHASFLNLDLTADPLPDADALLCRDCLVHLPFAAILDAFRNLRRGRIPRVILTTFLADRPNTDIPFGDWRPLNFRLAPFHLPEPLEVLVEECPENDGAYADKAIAVWATDQLPTELRS